MLSRFIVPFLLLLFFSFPTWGGQSQPDKGQKQPLADSSTSGQQQKKIDEQATANVPPPAKVPIAEDTEEDSSVFDDEHG